MRVLSITEGLLKLRKISIYTALNKFNFHFEEH
jgi:hypothetical protein